MSEPKVDFIYGIYPSSVHGNLILIDPILPPRKCILNCAICPLISSYKTTDKIKTDLKISPSSVLSSIDKCKPMRIEINGILLWGYGDPLLASNIYELLIILRASIPRSSFQGKLYIHSSLVPLVEACSVDIEKPECTLMKSIIEQIDGIILPFLWYDVDKYVLGWPQELNFNIYENTIRQVFENKYDKLFIELYLFKLHENYYPDISHLDEITIFLRHIRSKNIILKPIDRPTINPRLKPVPESHVTKVEEYFLNEGFKTQVERFNRIPSISWQCGVAHLLYNYILRIPLRYNEIRSLFGEIGLIALNNLLSKNYASKTTWAGEVFFIGNYK
ncbi:MAG: hypothetical protein QXF00_04550 [Desulfurococcaceae archaeon]